MTPARKQSNPDPVPEQETAGAAQPSAAAAATDLVDSIRRRLMTVCQEASQAYPPMWIEVVDRGGHQPGDDARWAEVAKLLAEVWHQLRVIMRVDPAFERDLGSFGMTYYGPDLSPELQVDSDTIAARHYRDLVSWQHAAMVESGTQAVDAELALLFPPAPSTLAPPAPRRRRRKATPAKPRVEP